MANLISTPFEGPDLDRTAAQVRALLDGGATLVDVREPYEYAAGHAAEAVPIEIERVASRFGEVPADRPVVFTCRGGVRGAMVARAFRAAGYDAYNLEGGMTAWAQAGLPLVPPGGSVAPH